MITSMSQISTIPPVCPLFITKIITYLYECTVYIIPDVGVIIVIIEGHIWCDYHITIHIIIHRWYITFHKLKTSTIELIITIIIISNPSTSMCPEMIPLVCHNWFRIFYIYSFWFKITIKWFSTIYYNICFICNKFIINSNHWRSNFYTVCSCFVPI